MGEDLENVLQPNQVWSHPHNTEKNSSQHYLPHPWPPTTISEAGEVPWSLFIRQTILDPTHWDGHQKGEQHTGFSRRNISRCQN